MIDLPTIETLQPELHHLSNGIKIYCFPSSGTELVKLDFLWEAGTAYQPHKLVASMTNSLYSAASNTMTAQELSRFLDFRGIIVDSNIDTLRASTTYYTLSRHLRDLVPVVAELIQHPSFPQEEFEVLRAKRRQELLTYLQRTPDMARRYFYEQLLGEEHPLGRHAVPEDIDRLKVEDVKRFYSDRYSPEGMDIVVAGKVDDHLLSLIDDNFGHLRTDTPHTDAISSLFPENTHTPTHYCHKLEGAAQATVRMGCVLPIEWNDPDYANFLILNTALGGYFGSRLMQNLREDKGYTYGIASRTMLFRGMSVFFITADVAHEAANDSETEIMNELRRLAEEPIPSEELDLVRTVVAGDFLRSVDGIFERSARFVDMLGSHVDERLTVNLHHALETVTPHSLQTLAERFLKPEQMTVVTVS